MACDSMGVTKGSCGTLFVRGENQRKVKTDAVAWTGGIKFTTQSEGCGKMAQYEWAGLLMRMMHDVWIREDFRAVPRRYLRRMDL